MVRSAWMCTLVLAASLASPDVNRVSAQSVVVYSPGVAYYYTPPAVRYYVAPVVYAPAPRVAYAYTPAVAYYTPPVAYYTPPAVATTTYYGLFGRPRASTSYYYPPVYVRP